MKNLYLSKLYQASTTKDTYQMIGLMSGTALDGLDIALVELGQGKPLKLLAFKTYDYDPAIRKEILSTMKGKLAQASAMNFKLGSLYSRLVNDFLKINQLNPQNILAIASHGQTVYHKNGSSSYQIGEADVIAKNTNIPVIYDFRSGDIAVGGTGAPLVAYLDYYLSQHNKNLNYAFQNLGGIGNVTFIDKQKNIQAFDTGPANILSNIFTSLATEQRQFFDVDAKLASTGNINQELLSYMLAHRFFKRDAPKSTGHEEFGELYSQELLTKFPNIKLVDFIRTSLRLTAISIKQAYQKYAPANLNLVILSGGGVCNQLLVNDIKEQLAQKGRAIKLFSEEFYLADEAKEAICFALLGWHRICGIKTNFKTVTGAKRQVSLGKIALPD
ncbi:MAG: anhydro-N-acetylmuramic acid kinase [SAR324 cluster bacterium]|nr:anhydro-N-acetylmuramic acid kinase [SAR324 cluster bacterium]